MIGRHTHVGITDGGGVALYHLTKCMFQLDTQQIDKFLLVWCEMMGFDLYVCNKGTGVRLKQV